MAHIHLAGDNLTAWKGHLAAGRKICVTEIDSAVEELGFLEGGITACENCVTKVQGMAYKFCMIERHIPARHYYV